MAQWLESVSPRARVLLGVLIALIIVAAALSILWATRTEYAVLFTRLTETDAAGVVTELKKQKVQYQLADDGTTIRVPADEVHEVRLALMAGGTPIAGGVGFEIFDKQGLGATEQSQRVSFQRALQGELARTVGALDGVQQARVHLVLPESTLFRRDRQEARASVSLKLESGVVLQNAQIFGIQRLVAAAVPGLEIGRVVVTDQHGITLSASDALTVGGATGEGRLTMKREVEEYVTRKIVALLDRTYGPGRAIVSVDATLNFDEVRRTVQDLLPPSVNQGNVRRRRQTTGAGIAADPASGFDTGAPAARGTTDTEYDYGRSVEQVVAAPGGVSRLSVGVIVPGSADAQTQNRIEDMVRVAAGISDERGDVVVVQSLDGLGSADFAPATAPAAAEPVESGAPVSGVTPVAAPAAKGWWQQWYALGLAGMVLVLLLLFAASRGGRSDRLSADERAQLLADVRASLERGTRPSPAGGAS